MLNIILGKGQTVSNSNNSDITFNNFCLFQKTKMVFATKRAIALFVLCSTITLAFGANNSAIAEPERGGKGKLFY